MRDEGGRRRRMEEWRACLATFALEGGEEWRECGATVCATEGGVKKEWRMCVTVCAFEYWPYVAV